MKDKKNIVIMSMIGAVLLLVIGFAALQTRLTIKGTSSITATWGIEITSITNSATGTAYNIDTPSYSGTNATINTGLRKPGDKMEYTITVKNTGSISAIIDEVTTETSGSDVILYSIEGIESQTRLSAGESVKLILTVEFDNNATSIPANATKEININIMCIQDDGQTLEPSDPSIDVEIDENSLAGKVLAANEEYADNVASTYVSSSTGIDFSQPSGDTNGKGLYYTSTNTEGDAKVYYFRGDVENNYVSFAGKTWRIVRINEDGSVRLITQENVGTSDWNSDNIYNLIESSNTNAQAGYMYGTYTASTYAETHTNTNNSDMKDYLDNWYTNNLSSYSGLLSTTAGFCNDRTVTNSEIDYSTTHLGTSTYNTDYGARYRLFYVNEPQFACPQTNDLFTVSGSSKGNKVLTKNIGLLTADEAIYAGAMSDEGAWDGWGDNEIPTDTTDYGTYLNIGSKWALMSPGSFYQGYVYMNYVNEYGNVYDAYMGSSGVRPVINLSMSAVISGGNGLSGSPYVVQTN